MIIGEEGVWSLFSYVVTSSALQGWTIHGVWVLDPVRTLSTDRQIVGSPLIFRRPVRTRKTNRSRSRLDKIETRTSIISFDYM